MDELTLEKLYQVRKSKDKQLIRGYEKKTVDGSNFRQGSYLFGSTITQGKDDVKCI